MRRGRIRRAAWVALGASLTVLALAPGSVEAQSTTWGQATAYRDG